MSLPSAYLITTKNVEAFFNTLLNAQAPERFSQKFLESLEFKSTNDRLFIGVLKFLKMIDENGVPTDRYYSFLDQSQSKKIIAEGIKDAYADLFTININAQNLTVDEVKNKLKTLTRGEKSENVLMLMASTFKALCEYAEWTKISTKKEEIKNEKNEQEKETNRSSNTMTLEKTIPSLNYNIQIHLPETRDAGVYDAIFKSLKDHIL